MKLHSVSVQIAAGVALALFSCGISNGHEAGAPLAQSAGEGPAQPPQLRRLQTFDDYKVVKLEQAYQLLEHMTADYEGHRTEAMHSISKAAEVLGFELHGKPRVEESQWKSDRRLKEAKHRLEEIPAESEGKEQPHIQRAIDELEKALAVKQGT
jgi:hypothetical protein